MVVKGYNVKGKEEQVVSICDPETVQINFYVTKQETSFPTHQTHYFSTFSPHISSINVVVLTENLKRSVA